MSLHECRDCQARLVKQNRWLKLDAWERAQQQRLGAKPFFLAGWCESCYRGQRETSSLYEPPIMSCSRCSERIILTPAQATKHRRPSNPGGVPHYCGVCADYLNVAA